MRIPTETAASAVYKDTRKVGRKPVVSDMEENITPKKKHQFKGERTRSTLIIVGCLLVYLLTLHFNIRIGYTLMTAAVSAIGVYELMHAIGTKSKVLYGIACGFSVLYILKVGFRISISQPLVILSFYALALLIVTVALNKQIKYTETVMAFFASVALTYSLSCFIRLNDLHYLNDRFFHVEGLFLIWMAFSCSWVTDAMAFLTGRKFGKHKMSPNISPKKSFEGAIGGTLITAVANIIILLCWSLITKKMGYAYFMLNSNLKYLYMFLISIVLSVVGMFGDLAASVLKRNVGIKDYSNLLPGHGGIMDRFDSCVFILPVLYGIYALIYG